MSVKIYESKEFNLVYDGNRISSDFGKINCPNHEKQFKAMLRLFQILDLNKINFKIEVRKKPWKIIAYNLNKKWKKKIYTEQDLILELESLRSF